MALKGVHFKKGEIMKRNLIVKYLTLSVLLFLLVACGDDSNNSQVAGDWYDSLGEISSASLDNPATTNPDDGLVNGGSTNAGVGDGVESSSSEEAPLSSSAMANKVLCKLEFSRYQGYAGIAVIISFRSICASVTECTVENMMPYEACVDNQPTVEGCYGTSPTVEVVEACPEEDALVCNFQEVGEVRFYGAGDKCESVPLDIFK